LRICSGNAWIGDAVKICLVGLQNLLGSHCAWQAASNRGRRFMAREFGDDRILAAYLDTFEQALHPRRTGAATPARRATSHG
jgi:hypothetical protein